MKYFTTMQCWAVLFRNSRGDVRLESVIGTAPAEPVRRAMLFRRKLDALAYCRGRRRAIGDVPPADPRRNWRFTPVRARVRIDTEVDA